MRESSIEPENRSSCSNLNPTLHGKIVNQFVRINVRTTAKRRGSWLVVISGREISWLDAYRCLYSQLRLPSDFKKIFVAFADGRVASLTDESV